MKKAIFSIIIIALVLVIGTVGNKILSLSEDKTPKSTDAANISIAQSIQTLTGNDSTQPSDKFPDIISIPISPANQPPAITTLPVRPIDPIPAAVTLPVRPTDQIPDVTPLPHQ